MKLFLECLLYLLKWSVINNYWTRSSKISWFVCGEQIIICQFRRRRQIMIWETLTNDILRYPSSIKLFYHSITEFVFLMNILGKRSSLPFSRKNDRKKEKSTVSSMHVQNIICSQTQLDGITHEQTIICGQLFAGHLVGSRPMKRKKNLLWMIITVLSTSSCPSFLRAMCSKQKSKIMQIYGKKEKIVGWRLGFTSLGRPPSFLPITLHVCSQSTVNQKKKKRLPAVYYYFGIVILTVRS